MLLLFKFKVTFEAKNTGGAIGKLDFEEMWAHVACSLRAPDLRIRDHSDRFLGTMASWHSRHRMKVAARDKHTCGHTGHHRKVGTDIPDDTGGSVMHCKWDNILGFVKLERRPFGSVRKKCAAIARHPSLCTYLGIEVIHQRVETLFYW